MDNLGDNLTYESLHEFYEPVNFDFNPQSDNQILVGSLEYDQYIDLRQPDLHQPLIETELDFNQEQFLSLENLVNGQQQSVCNQINLDTSEKSNQIIYQNDCQINNHINSQIDNRFNSQINYQLNNQFNNQSDHINQIDVQNDIEIDNSSLNDEFKDLKLTNFFFKHNDLAEYEFDSTSKDIFDDIYLGDVITIDNEEIKRKDIKDKLDDFIKAELRGITEDFELNHELDFNEKNFCELCNKIFNLPDELAEHLCSQNASVEIVQKSSKVRKSKNDGIESIIKCDFCFYTSTKMTKMKRHFLTHTREKPFKCSYCGSSFTQSGSLKTHLNKEHINEEARNLNSLKKTFKNKKRNQNKMQSHLNKLKENKQPQADRQIDNQLSDKMNNLMSETQAIMNSYSPINFNQIYPSNCNVQFIYNDDSDCRFFSSNDMNLNSNQHACYPNFINQNYYQQDLKQHFNTHNSMTNQPIELINIFDLNNYYKLFDFMY